MKVLIIYAHPNPMSFTHAILENFVRGLKEVGHQYEIVDLNTPEFILSTISTSILYWQWIMTHVKNTLKSLI